MLRAPMLTALALALLAPAAASAAPARPAAVTGAAANVQASTATLNGRVDANEADTTYFFEYGTTRVYEARSPATPAGARKNPVAVSVPIAGLAPATTYHYRLVASNARGVARGEDRTFKTRRVPLGFTLAPTINPIAPGGSTVLAGQLTGTANAGRQIVVQSNPWPYTQGFVTTGNPLVTNPDGTFAFPIVGLGVSTQFKAVLPANPAVQSAIVAVDVALQVRTSARKVKRSGPGAKVRFRGSVSPARPGALVHIQKLRAGVWQTIAQTHARAADATRSTYSRRKRIYRSGQFRVVVESVGDFTSGVGRTVSFTIR